MKAKPEGPKSEKPRSRGSIQKRGTAWRVLLYTGTDANGKRQYRTETVRGARRAAQRKLTEMLSKLDAGTLPSPSRETLNAYLDRWLETKKAALSRRTASDYEYLLKTHVRPVIGKAKLIDLRPRHVQAVYSAMTARGLAGRTVHVTHNVLRQALAQAVKWQELAVNPADAVSLPRWERAEVKALTREQVRAFLEKAEGDSFAVYFHLAFATGMRPGELLGLRWQDVDLEAGRLHVRVALERVRGEAEWALKEPKAHSRRTLPLEAPLVERLKAHKAAQAKRIMARRAKGRTWLHHGLVFTGRCGEPMDARNLAFRHLKPILAAAGLPAEFTLYGCRHTCATLLAAADVSPKVIAERLGHRDATLTLNVYTHVSPGMQERASQTLSELIYG